MHTAEKYRTSRDAALIWEGHKVGRQIGYCHLEKLHRLELLPADVFTVVCSPVKIRGASAGWTRAVAVLNDLGGMAMVEGYRGMPGQLPPTAT